MSRDNIDLFLFTYGKFSDNVSSSDCIALTTRINE